MKIAARVTAYLIAVILLFEGTSLLFWKLYGITRIPYHARLSTDLEHLAASVKKSPSQTDVADSELGWTPNTAHQNITEDGARRSPILQNKGQVSAYGDSFVFGSDVTNEETFPNQLSLMIGSSVTNYGVGGYGPDQAILRLERHLSAGQRPEIVILGMPSENIARVVNVVRSLYIPLEGVHFSKPIFVKEGEQWRLVNSVPEWPPSTKAWKTLLRTAHEFDRWYEQNESRPRLRFPYSLATIQTVRFFSFDILRWQDLYKDSRALSTMQYIVRRFVGLSKRYGFTPVFVVIPMPEDLLRLKSSNSVYFSDFLNSLRREFHKDLTVVDVLAQEFDLERFHVRPFAGHASAHGNRVVATAIYERIRPIVDN